MARPRAARCTHGHGLSLCFECFREGSERTRARQEAWAQRALPFDPSTSSGQAADHHAERKLSAAEVAHRRRMLEYLQSTARQRTSA